MPRMACMLCMPGLADMAGLVDCVCVGAPCIPFRNSKLEIDAQFQNMSTIGKSNSMFFSEKSREK
jgi:hypothetical protein